MPIEREDLEGYVTLLREDIKRVETGINARLDSLNGKTNKNTTDIAVLQALAAQEKENTTTTARNHGAGWGATLGTVVSVMASFLYQYFFGTPLK